MRPNKSSRGRLITLEGGEGAGKSTHARFIRDWLEQNGRKAILTREPGGSAQAEAVRELILRTWPEGMSPMTELLLMFAARAAHMRDTIEPALSSGTDVVCDRFIDSSYAYQGAGKGVSTQKIEELERMVLGRMRPQLTLVFDLDVETGLQRTHKRGERNRFEDETLAFMQRVRRCFLKRAKSAPRRYALIDAAPEINIVQEQIRSVLERRL